jgi:hypothetical protein
MGARALIRQIVPRWARVQASAAVAHARSARLDKELAGMVSNGRPIVAGPWLGEVGFELLYWVPFLAWFAEQFGVEAQRLLVISRGGTASWYAPFAGRYADVFDHATPEAFKAQHDERLQVNGEQKQTRDSDFERGLIDSVAARHGLRAWNVLHPSRMYHLFNPYWWGHLSTGWVHSHTRYRALTPPDAAWLPASAGSGYVATKFYFNECFPATDANRAFVRKTLAALAARGPVVALSTGLNIDDHQGERVDGDGVLHLPEGIDPARNLAVQSALVAGARAFVGTYGGFSYLAPFYRVPSYAYFGDEAGFSRKHLDMARSAFDRIGAPGLLNAHGVDEDAPPLAAGAGRG